jgi:hypothetical protein
VTASVLELHSSEVAAKGINNKPHPNDNTIYSLITHITSHANENIFYELQIT